MNEQIKDYGKVLLVDLLSDKIGPMPQEGSHVEGEWSGKKQAESGP